MPVPLLRFRSVHAKILLPVVVLLATAAAVTVLIVDRHVRAQALTEARQTLHTTDAVFRNSLDIRERNLLTRFGSFVSEPRFRAVSQLGDRETMEAFLADSLAQFGNEVEFALYTPVLEREQSRVSRSAGLDPAAFALASAAITEEALAGLAAASMVFLDPLVLNVVAIPVHIAEEGRLNGVLTIGLRLNASTIEELKSLTLSEVMLHAGDHWVLGTLPPAVHSTLPESLEADFSGHTSDVFSVVIEDEHYHASRGIMPTAPGSGKVGYALLASYEPRLRALTQTRATLLGISLLTVLVGSLLITSLIRRITQPLRELRDGAEAVGRGDFSHEIHLSTVDECGDLAASFNHMTRNLRSSHAELRDSEERLRLILEGARDHAIFTIDPGGRISRWYPAASRILGYSSDEAQGLAYAQLFAAEETLEETPASRLQTVLQSGKLNWEGWRVRRDGTRFWADITLSLLSPDTRGRSHGFVEIARDVTARREAEQAMREARDAAQAANAAKSDFLANMSHEIRTPMNGILGMANLLAGQFRDEETGQMVSTIQTSAESLLVIIDDILDIAKIENGRIDVEIAPSNYLQELEKALQLFAPECDQKGLKLALVLGSDVPEQIATDLGRLRQIILNLLGNAVKFTAAGSITMTVSKISDAGKPRLEIAIQDTGIGIPASALVDIFEPFRQADNSTSRRFGGTGLGLTISRQLVELLGGTIHVQSHEGKGSRFSLRLPLEVARSTPTPPKAPPPSATGPATTAACDASFAVKNPLRILVAEDNAINAKVIGLILRRLGYAFDLAKNGLEAVEANRQQPYDVILMDLQMPEMDGIEAAREILQSNPAEGTTHPAIVALTANAHETNRKQCAAVGMTDFISKPAKIERIGEVLAAVAEHRGVPQATE